MGKEPADLPGVAAALQGALDAEPALRSAWRFASRAVGRARRDSDLDVAVWLGRDASF